MRKTKILASRCGRYVAAFLLIALATAAQAGTTAQRDTTRADGERPVIGLALGGGGARGFAHIGVLQRLEELRVPVDRIAGTSMGAIVGSLYALGMTADEIESIVHSIDWRELMTDRPPRTRLSYRRKTDDNTQVWPFEMGFDENGLAVQRALIAGQNLAFAFDAPGIHSTGYESFDDLPIPFRAVATDMMTAESVELDRGNLLRSVRASMSVPGAFPPVHIDGRMLMDGFLLRNLPVDVVRFMGSEEIIGVQVAWGPGETELSDLNSLPGVLMQANNVATYGYEGAQLAESDVPILVPMRGIAAYDFNKATEAIAAGRAAVEPHVEALRRLSVSPEEYERWRTSIRKAPPTLPAIDRIELRNNSPVHDGTILSRITQPVGEPLDLELLSRDLGRVYELGVFETVDFALEPHEGGQALVVETHEKPYLPWIFRIGGTFQLNNQNRGRLQLVMRATRLEMNDMGGEVRVDFGLGTRTELGVEWYQPLERSRTLFLAPGGVIGSEFWPIYNDDYHAANFTAKGATAALDAGLSFGRFGELRAGYRFGYTRSWNTSGEKIVPDREDTGGALRLAATWDQLDNLAMPHHGTGGGLASWLARPGLGGDLDFSQYVGYFLGAFEHDRWTVQYRFQGGGSEGEVPYYRNYTLGGLRNVTGMPDNGLRGNAFGMGGAGLLYQVSGVSLPYASQWYAGLWGDVGNAWYDPKDARWDDLLVGGAVTIAAETAFGPLELGYGRSSTGRDTAYLQMGIQFAHPMNF